jgi:hypothetical protein
MDTHTFVNCYLISRKYHISPLCKLSTDVAKIIIDYAHWKYLPDIVKYSIAEAYYSYTTSMRYSIGKNELWIMLNNNNVIIHLNLALNSPTFTIMNSNLAESGEAVFVITRYSRNISNSLVVIPCGRIGCERIYATMHITYNLSGYHYVSIKCFCNAICFTIPVYGRFYFKRK